MKRGCLKLLLLFGLATAYPAFAASPILDELAGTWNDLDNFASLGQCINAPATLTPLLCSPAQLAAVTRGRFEGRGTVSATDSALSLSDKLRNKSELSTSDVNSLFQDYNYSDVLLNVDLNYVGQGFLVGVKPLRYQGQFQIHNPNLPLASMVLRDDRDFHAAFAHGWGGDILRFRVGASGALLFRDESILEASVVDLATSTPKQLIDEQKLNGLFFDVGGTLEYRSLVQLSVLGKDLGGWLKGASEHASRTLFLRPDKTAKVFADLSVLPQVWRGKLQVGVSAVRFNGEPNDLSQQWFGTLSYYLGPLRVLTGWRPDLFRSGLAVRFDRFEANVAQEWVNHLADGRKAQPRFTFEVTSGL